MDRNNNTTLKNDIKALVEKKIALTKERRAYKLETRGKVDESTRRAFFYGIDIERSDTKSEIRHSLLAYGYLRGMDYRRMEKHCRVKPAAVLIKEILEAHHVEADKDNIKRWLKGDRSQFFRPREEAAA